MKMTSNLQHWLIRHAARSAPGELAARLEEEWLADLSERPSYFSRLRFAIGCCWATQVIAFENRPARPVISAAVGARGMIALPDAFAHVSRRSSTFVLVLALHAALFYLVVTTVTRTHHEVTPAPLQNQVLNIARPVEPKIDEQPKQRLTFELPPLPLWRLPPTDIVDDKPLVEDKLTSQSGDDDHSHAPPDLVPLPPPTHVPSTVQGGPGAGFPNPDDFYPGPAKRLNEEGSATLQVCVDAKGRLTGIPVATQSSGSVRLDQGAIKLASTASGHYRPTTEDGRPVSACYPLRIRFQIKE